MDSIIKELEQYSQDFVEKPHPQFSNRPVCPFAKWARLKNKIDYFIHDLHDLNNIVSKIQSFSSERSHEIVWLVHPSRDFPQDDLEKLAESLAKIFPEFEFFTGHPDSEFEFNGEKTRREPYPNIIVQDKEFLTTARKLNNEKTQPKP